MDGVTGVEEWNRPVLRRLYLATKRAQELLGHAMAEEGATVATWGALDAIELWGRPGGISQAELATAVRVEQATMTVQIRKMLEQGLCERVADSSDRRVRRITITKRGRELLVRLRARAADVETDILAPLSGRQRDELATLLTLLGEADTTGSAPKRSPSDASW